MIFKTCLPRRCCYLTYPKHVLDHVISSLVIYRKLQPCHLWYYKSHDFFGLDSVRLNWKTGPHALSFCLRALLSFSYHSLCVWRKKHKAFALKLLQRINSGAPSHKPKLNLSFFAISFPVVSTRFDPLIPKHFSAFQRLRMSRDFPWRRFNALLIVASNTWLMFICRPRSEFRPFLSRYLSS